MGILTKLRLSLEEEIEESKAKFERDGKTISEMSPTLVISALPCLGKSRFVKEHPEKAMDLELLLYKHKVDKSLNENYVEDYINALKHHLQHTNWKYIFISATSDILNELTNQGIQYYVLYPSRDRKEEIVNACKARGNSSKWYQSYADNFEGWINTISSRPNSYELKGGEFISDKLFDGRLSFLHR